MGVLRRFRAKLLRPIAAPLKALAADQRAMGRTLDLLREDVRQVRLAVASLRASQARAAATLSDAEFQGYSQFGEDGAIQWLLARVPMASRTFVEFGVGDYHESNTRFLLEHDGWRGLILDRDVRHIRFLQESGLAWRSVIEARSGFITAENINEHLAGMPEDIGLLSVDVDGMDYWVLTAITAVRPRIVVCEYNSLFGPTAAVTVPYDPSFERTAAHHSTLYFGASISALGHWASQRGYRLVGSSAEGVNAFFVREDVAGDLPNLPGAEAWVATPVRQARDAEGRLTYMSGLDRQRALIADLPLVDVMTGSALKVADLPPIGD